MQYVFVELYQYVRNYKTSSYVWNTAYNFQDFTNQT